MTRPDLGRRRIGTLVLTLTLTLAATVLPVPTAPARAQTVEPVTVVSAPDAADDDLFGAAVAVSDGWLVSTAHRGDDGSEPNPDDSGSAYLFRRDDAGVWEFATELVPSDPPDVRNWRFGWTAAIAGTASDGNGGRGNLTIAIGAPDFSSGPDPAAYLYSFVIDADTTFDPITTESIKITRPANAGRLFAESIDVEQFTLADGSADYGIVVGDRTPPDNSTMAYSYLYRSTPGGVELRQTNELISASGEPARAESVAITRFDIVVGESTANTNGISFAGAVHVYQLGTDPTLPIPPIATFVEPTPTENGFFGRVVALSHDVLAIGAGDRTPGPGNGEVFVVPRNDGQWGPPTELPIGPTGGGHSFGVDLSVVDNTVAVAGFEHGRLDRDGVSLYEQSSQGDWSLREFVPWGGTVDAQLTTAALDDDGTVVMGDPVYPVDGLGRPGQVRVGRVDLTASDVPSLQFELATPPEVMLAPTSLRITDLQPTANRNGTLAATSLGAIDVADTPLAGIVLGDTPLAGIVLRSAPLAGIPLLDIEVDDGWPSLLAGSVFDNAPINTLTFGDVIADPETRHRIEALPLAGIEVEGVPLAGIPLAGIALSATPLAGIPLAGIDADSTDAEIRGAWCRFIDPTVDASALCGASPTLDVRTTTLADLPLAGIPLAGIPLAGIPLAGIDPDQLRSSPLAGIPLAGIDIDSTPLAAIPLAGIPLAGIDARVRDLDPASVPLAGIDLRDLPVDGTPLAGIPLAGIPLAGIDVAGSPLAGIPLAGILVADASLASTPLAGIPLAGIPLAGIPLAGIPLAGIAPEGSPLAGIALDALPLAGIDVAGSPLAGIPLAGIPLAGIPLAGIPLAGIPLAGIPLAGIPLAGIEIGSTALADLLVVDVAVADSPLAGISLAAIVQAGIGLTDLGIECDRATIDCELGTLGDAVAGGIVDTTVALAQIQTALAPLTLADLRSPLRSEGALRAALDASALRLADLTDFGDLRLGDLPADRAGFGETTLGELAGGLARLTLFDLVRALVDPATGEPLDSTAVTDALSAALAALTDADGNALTLADLTDAGDVTLGDIVGGLDAPVGLDALGKVLADITVQAILDAYGIDIDQVELGSSFEAPLADLDAELTLGDLLFADGRSVGGPDIDIVALLELLGVDALDGLTLGDLLPGYLAPGRSPLREFELDPAGSTGVSAQALDDVDVVARFETVGATSPAAVEVVVDLPPNSAYVAESSRLTSQGSPDDAPITPEVRDGQLRWIVTGVQPGQQHTIDFAIRPDLRLGTTTITGVARIAGVDASPAAATGSFTVREGLEPNDFALVGAQRQVTPADDDEIFLTAISSSDDIDVFEIRIAANDRLSASLSNLSADFDLALYRAVEASGNGDAGGALSGVRDGEPIIPITDPDQPEGDSEPLADFARLGDIDPADDTDVALIEVSNAIGTATEIIATDRLAAGTYYLQVFGANGATSARPAALQIQIDRAEAPPACAAPDPVTPRHRSDLSEIELAEGTNTLILVNETRLAHFHSVRDRNRVQRELNRLRSYLGRNEQLGTRVEIVSVDRFSDVRDAYAAWDAADGQCDSAAANAVVAAINSLIDPVRDQLDHIVIVGGDEQIPMARLHDATTIANEYDYRYELQPTSGQRNAFTSTFWDQRFLSDDPYGERAAQRLADRHLYVPDLALGRLVETPDDIVRALRDFRDHAGMLDIDSAAVLGYDFLVDGSEEISAALAEAPELAGSLDTTLADGIDDRDQQPWDRGDAEQVIAEQGRGSIISLNAHFDHYRALPAVGDRQPNFTDNLLAATVRGLDVRQSLLFSMGCHGGLAVPDTTVSGPGDWAQAISAGGGIYVANTGFGYGDTVTVAYSEALMAAFARHVVQPVAGDGQLATTVGQALTFAKNDYIAGLSVLSVYDEKASMESTFFGLPFYRVGSGPVAPSIPDTDVENDPFGNPTSAVTVDVDHREVEPAVDTDGDGQPDEGIGSYFSNDPARGSAETIVAPGRPVQPAVVTDVSVVDESDPTRLALEARGALVTAMTSTWVDVDDPVVATPIFDQAATQPEPDLNDLRFPAQPVNITTRTTPSGDRQNVVVATGQFRADDDGDGTGTQRLDGSLELVVLYADPTDPDAAADRRAPRLGSIRSAIDADGVVTISLDAVDAHRVERIVVLAVGYDADADAQGDAVRGPLDWVAIDLVRTGDVDSDGRSRWTGSGQFNPGDTVEFLIQAHDEFGNVGVASSKATNFADSTVVGGEAPDVSLDLITNVAGDLDSASGWYRGAVTVETNIAAAGGDFTVNGSAPATLTGGSFTIDGDGVHTWSVRRGDGATASGIVRIDASGPPEILMVAPAHSVVYAAGSSSVDVRCFDPSLVSCSVAINGTLTAPGAPLPGTPGVYLAVASASDALGQTSQAVSIFTIVEAPVEPLTIVDANVADRVSLGEQTVLDLTVRGGAGVIVGHTVRIDWGDGQTATTTRPNADGLVDASHTYTTPGLYDILVTVVDPVGTTAEKRITTIVSGDGSVRATGRVGFWSPIESTISEPGFAVLTFNATRRQPEGAIRGRLRLSMFGQFALQSTDIDVLGYTPDSVVLAGSGQLNGVAGHHFTVEMSSAPDVEVRVLIESPTGEVLYDGSPTDPTVFGRLTIRPLSSR